MIEKDVPEPGAVHAPVRIFDTTLRDGEQSPGFSMNVQEKLVLAHQLARLGVDVIEAGFPAASEQDFEAVETIAQTVGREHPVTICGLARSSSHDLRRAYDAVHAADRPRIHLFLATSEVHLEHKLKMSHEEVLERAVAAVREARSLCEDIEFSPEDATRSEFPFLRDVVTAVIEAGASTINVPDTVGYTTPQEYAALITRLRKEVPGAEDVVFSVHCHDDLGLPLRTRWPRSTPERARSSVRSTASESEPGTRRSRSS